MEPDEMEELKNEMIVECMDAVDRIFKDFPAPDRSVPDALRIIATQGWTEGAAWGLIRGGNLAVGEAAKLIQDTIRRHETGGSDDSD